MSRILIAAEQTGSNALERLLAPDHELSFAMTMKVALGILKRQAFDLIAIGVSFDDSRMFELMAEIKSIPAYEDKPILCFCAEDSPLTRILHESISSSALLLGARAYLAPNVYNAEPNPDEAIRRVVEQCLTSKARRAVIRKLIDMQGLRAELLRLSELQGQEAEAKDQLSELLSELAVMRAQGVDMQSAFDTSRDLEDFIATQLRNNGDAPIILPDAAAKEEQVDKSKRWRRKLVGGSKKPENKDN